MAVSESRVISLSRSVTRDVVDPIILKMRQDLYGSGVTYSKYLREDILPPSVPKGDNDVIEIVEDAGFIRGLTVYSGSYHIADDQKIFVFGGMNVSTSGDTTFISLPEFGTHNHDDRYYTKTEIQTLLSAKANLNHSHTHFDISDWTTAVATHPAVAANTEKVTNATHTGDVTGSGYLTIQLDAVTLDKIADSGALEGQVILYHSGNWIVGYPEVGSGVLVIHASTHYSGGTDPIDPSGIGAATQIALDQEIADRIDSLNIHSSLIASPTTLGHIKVGQYLTIDPDGTLNAISVSGIQDVTIAHGDLLYNYSGEITRLPVGPEGYYLSVINATPVWTSFSGIDGVTVIDEDNTVYSSVKTLKFLHSLVTEVSGLATISPGLSIFDRDGNEISQYAHTIDFASGFDVSIIGAGHVRITTTTASDLNEHAAVVATDEILGHVIIGDGIDVTESGVISFKGITVTDSQNETELTNIKVLNLYRGRVQASGDSIARLLPAIFVETIDGTVINAHTEILALGAGITATASGQGRVVLTAAQAEDFIVQTITDGLTTKAPSSDAVYDHIAALNFDDRYFTKAEISGFLSMKANVTHTHLSSQILDFDAAVSNVPDVVANTAKVSNATHIGEVEGSGYLTIKDGVVTLSKLFAEDILEGQVIIFRDGEWQYGTPDVVAVASGDIDGGFFTTPGATIRLKRGNAIDAPTLAIGELGWRLDTQELYIGHSTGDKLIQNAIQLRGRPVETDSPTEQQVLIWSEAQDAWVNGMVEYVNNAGNLAGYPPEYFLNTSHLTTYATTSGWGHVRIGTGIHVDSSGIITNDIGIVSGELTEHSTKIASTTELGHIIVGNGLSIDPFGVLSAAAGSGEFSDPTVNVGDIIYRGPDGLTKLPIGDDGQFLSVYSGLPSWSNADSIPPPESVLTDEFEIPGALNSKWTVLNSSNIVTNDVSTTHAGAYYAKHRDEPGQGDFISGIYQTMTGADFEVTAKVSVLGRYADYLLGGLGIREASGNKIALLSLARNAAGGLCNFLKYNSPTSFNSGAPAAGLQGFVMPTLYMKLRLESGVIWIHYSLDGLYWQLIHTETWTFFTPGYVGLFINNVNTGLDAELICDWFRFKYL